MTITMNNKRWKDLSTGQKVGIAVAGIAQISLLIAALVDIQRREPEEINGSKHLWRAVSFINWIGPISYFIFGRSR